VALIRAPDARDCPAFSLEKELVMKKVLLALLFPTLAFAGDAKDAKAPAKDAPKDAKAAPAAPAQPAPPPEIKATVDAFKGNWKFDTTLTATGIPGMDKPAKASMTFNCKTVAGGNAVDCEAKSKTPMGPFEGQFMVAYDPYGKQVHFIGITNQFEVHDHLCKWAGTDLNCTPLKAGSGPGGDEITEDLTMKFDKNTVSFTSTSHMKGGATMVFEGKGKK
jgi:hypothetical protein